jgi:ribonuclease HII
MDQMLGLDEAGVGPAFGNLVACALHIPSGVEFKGLTDSKKLSEKKRETLFEPITNSCLFGIGQVTNEEIDTGGLAEARRLVFDRALDDFAQKYPNFDIQHLIIDGTIFRPWKAIPFECIPQADAKYPAVSAASVVAKVTRDRQVVALCDQVPELHEKYGIKNNKGYLSKEHLQGIAAHGKSLYHRHSYNIKNL